MISFLLNSLELSNVKMLKLKKPNAITWFMLQFFSFFYLPIVLYDQLKLKPDVNKLRCNTEPFERKRQIKMCSSRLIDLT